MVKNYVGGHFYFIFKFIKIKYSTVAKFIIRSGNLKIYCQK